MGLRCRIFPLATPGIDSINRVNRPPVEIATEEGSELLKFGVVYDNESGPERTSDDACVAGVLDSGMVDGGSDRVVVAAGRTAASDD